MPNPRIDFFRPALFVYVMAFSGCHHFSIKQPQPPPIDPSSYSITDYNADVTSYKTATNPGTADQQLAKQKRNDIVFGLMGQIDVVYGAYYNELFSRKSTVAVGSDALTLGLSTASTIATHAATKTILSALGTGFAGVALSADKNFFAQQAFPVIGVAMQTRRDKVRAKIVENLGLDSTAYPLAAAKRDLVAYFNAGTLASGLQELQEEAGAATAATVSGAGTTKPSAPGNLRAVGGDAQVSLLWSTSSGATSYNLYSSTTTGVTPTTGTKTSGLATNSYTHTGLTNGTTYYYVVTSVNANGESGPSSQASAVPAAPVAAGAGRPSAPTSLNAAGSNLQVSLNWALSPGAATYNLYYSTAPGVTTATGTRIVGLTANTYTHTGLNNGTAYYYVVTAENANGESSASAQTSATPSALQFQLLERMVLTPH